MSDLSAKPEKNYRAKTKQADSQSGYLGDKIVGSTYINVTEEDGSVGKRLKLEVDSSALVDGIVDHKVLVSSGDTTENYLFNKLVEGNAITLTQQNIGGNENILIDASYTEGDGIDITDDEISLDADLDDLNDVYSPTPSNGDLLRYDNASGKWVDDYTLEGTFTGTTTKVPSSSAVSNVLQTCMITDDDDLGTSGDALMYHAEFMEPTRLHLITDTDAKASNILDANFPKASSMIAVTPTIGDDGDGNYQLFGNFEIVTEETPAAVAPYYNAAFAKFFTHEFYAKDFPLGGGKHLYLDIFLNLKTTGAPLSELKLKIHPYYAEEGDSDFGTFYAPQTLTVKYDGSTSDTYQWETVSFTGFSSDVNPQAIAFFITVQSEDATPTATYTAVHWVHIAGLRLRYPKRTIGLRKSDVTL